MHNRRQFASTLSSALGTAALASLLQQDAPAAESATSDTGLRPHVAARASRVIYLFQSGAPSQIDLFDEKPGLRRLQGTELPDSIRRGQRLTGMTATQDSFPVAPSRYAFKACGRSGTRLSQLLPFTAGIADDLCLIRSLSTEAINHDPAITFFQTGA